VPFVAKAKAASGVVLPAINVLEPVTGAAAGEPDVLVLRVAIDEEVAGGRVLVLADATLNEWCGAHTRESATHPRSRGLDAVVVDLAVFGVRIERRAVGVDPHLQPAPFEIGNAVDPRHEINPCGHVWRAEPIVSSGGAEVHDHLPRGHDSLTEELREYRWQPCPAREYECVASECRPVCQLHG
jgi:hypothetical protein